MNKLVIAVLVIGLAIGFGIGFSVRNPGIFDNGAITSGGAAVVSSGEAIIKSIKDKTIVVEFNISGERLEREVAAAGAVVTGAADKSEEEYQKYL